MADLDLQHSVGITTPQYFEFGEQFGTAPLKLESGNLLSDVTLCYETYGTLSEKKDNAIFVFHALSGDAHAAGYHSLSDRKPGWWDLMIGPGKAFDTNRYFIVSSSTIGSCVGSTGPNSINPFTGKKYRLSFPMITVADMVNAQKRLMEHLQIPQWLAVAGGSMGGMQALQWAVAYPECVRLVIPVATTFRSSTQSVAFHWVGRHAIMTDPQWKNGNYEDLSPNDGLATARMLAHITYLSEQSMEAKFARRLQDAQKYSYDFASYDFAVESYLTHQGKVFIDRFDANAYLYITRAIDYFDLTCNDSISLSCALKLATMPFLVISFSSDWLYPPFQSLQLVNALKQNGNEVEYNNIESPSGHDAFLLEANAQTVIIKQFLDKYY